MTFPNTPWTTPLALLAALAIAGCGDDGASPSDAPTDPADTTTEDGSDAGGTDPTDGGLDAGADSGTDTVEAPPLPDSAAVDLPEPTLRRLTNRQYRNAIRDVFSPDVVLAGAIEPDVIINGLVAVGSSAASISPRGVEQFAAASYSIAQQALDDPASRARYLTCVDDGPADAACARSVLEAIAQRAWRRPPTGEELDRLSDVTNTAASVLGTLDAGLQYGIAAILQSPNFLYRAEFVPGATAAATPLNDWALASRLAFFLWNSIPDDELLDAARSGTLQQDEVLLAQIDRMQDDPRFADGIRAFFADLYHLDGLDRLSKDSTIFPHMSPDVGPAAREETLRFVEHIVLERDGDVSEFVTLPVSFVNRKLASIYNVRAPERDGFGQIEFSEADGRRGLLGQVSLLALHSHPISTSPTLRGRFIREVLLCGEIEPPPADVDTALPEPDGDAVTLRDRIQRHLDQSTTCGACHIAMDPLGLSLENFDSLGRWRTIDNGAPIDPSGDLDGVPFNDAWHIADVIAEHPDYARCFVTNLYRYTLGRRNVLGDREQLFRLQEWFDASGRRTAPLMRSIAASAAFRSSGPLSTTP
jgi:hypothetical protein